MTDEHDCFYWQERDWQERALKARFLASLMHDRGVQATMEGIAKTYDRLAESAAEREAEAKH